LLADIESQGRLYQYHDIIYTERKGNCFLCLTGS